MTPTLNILPNCVLELRPLRRPEPAAGQERAWLLCSRDDLARTMWEIVLDTPTMHTMLECFAEGQTSVEAGIARLQVYPDAELERSVMRWATQQLARYLGRLGEAMPFGRQGMEPATGASRLGYRLV